jgi:hypothetical protein
LETAPRYFLHSGHQLGIRLAEFDQSASKANSNWSGAEIRLILQPLQSPPVQTLPNEFVTTNYVAGFGLAVTSEDSILKLVKELPCEPTAEANSPESAELREARARLAKLRTQFAPSNKLVQDQTARVKALENK